jgi:hypothetical protein
VVVLNLAIEYVPSVISEGFTLSLLTAVLLKLALELVILVKNRILTRLRAANTTRAKLAAAVCLWVVAAGSKLVVLELVDLVYGAFCLTLRRRRDRSATWTRARGARVGGRPEKRHNADGDRPVREPDAGTRLDAGGVRRPQPCSAGR